MNMNFAPYVVIIFNETILRILNVWEEACQQCVSMQYIPTVTSGLEGEHSQDPESGHYYARAVDFRSRDIPFEVRHTLKQTAQEMLGSEYYVMLSEKNFHIQRNKNTF